MPGHRRIRLGRNRNDLGADFSGYGENREHFITFTRFPDGQHDIFFLDDPDAAMQPIGTVQEQRRRTRRHHRRRNFLRNDAGFSHARDHNFPVTVEDPSHGFFVRRTQVRFERIDRPHFQINHSLNFSQDIHGQHS